MLKKDEKLIKDVFEAFFNLLDGEDIGDIMANGYSKKEATKIFNLWHKAGTYKNDKYVFPLIF